MKPGDNTANVYSTAFMGKGGAGSVKGEVLRAVLICGLGTRFEFQIPVHFNPRELSITSSSGGEEEKSADGKKKKQNVNHINTDLSVSLYFDADNAPKLQKSLGQNLKQSLKTELSPSAEKGITAAFPDDGGTVTDIINAMQRAIETDVLRQVSFSWGSFVFIGTLKSVRCNITLFDRNGNPKRVTVDLSIGRTIENLSQSKPQVASTISPSQSPGGGTIGSLL